MLGIRVAPTRAAHALNLLRTIQAHPPSCPCHSHTTTSPHDHGHSHSQLHPHRPLLSSLRQLASASPVPRTQTPLPDYAFEMAASNIRFGPGATAEVGMDAVNLGGRRVLVVTDRRIGKLPVVQQVVIPALEKEKDAGNIDAIEVYDNIVIEPKDYS